MGPNVGLKESNMGFPKARFTSFKFIALVGLVVVIEYLSPVGVLASPDKGSASVAVESQTIDLRDNPGSIIERLKKDAEPKDYLFQFPGFSKVLKPWYDWKANLENKYGFRFGISYTALYQKTNDNYLPEDDAAGFDLDIAGIWTFLGRGTDSPTILGFDLFRRDTLGTEISPSVLFTQYGSLYSGAPGFGEEDFVLAELWLHQKFGNVFELRAGKVFPVSAYDFFPFSNFRTDFIDMNNVVNVTIPLPLQGLGAFATYRPQSDIMLRLGAHDANADMQASGFDTFNGELFTIVEVGLDTNPAQRKLGLPPNSHVHVSLWHIDEREDAGIDDGWGISATVAHQFDHFTPFIRYGYADVTAEGPTSARQMASAGLAIDGILHHTSDRLGVGYTWADPADRTLGDQNAINAYYRIQLTPEIQVSPIVEVIFDPVSNPDKDTVFVWGLRARIAL